MSETRKYRLGFDIVRQLVAHTIDPVIEFCEKEGRKPSHEHALGKFVEVYEQVHFENRENRDPWQDIICFEKIIAAGILAMAEIHASQGGSGLLYSQVLDEREREFERKLQEKEKAAAEDAQRK